LEGTPYAYEGKSHRRVKNARKNYDDYLIIEDDIAFANTAGGELYFGVEESGEITGVRKDYQRLPKHCGTRCFHCN
jgi:predicted HTH transcriptional regulator